MVQKKNGLYDQTNIISTFKNIMDDLLNKVVVKGVKGITNLIVTENNKTVNNNGNMKILMNL